MLALTTQFPMCAPERMDTVSVAGTFPALARGEAFEVPLRLTTNWHRIYDALVLFAVPPDSDSPDLESWFAYKDGDPVATDLAGAFMVDWDRLVCESDESRCVVDLVLVIEAVEDDAAPGGWRAWARADAADVFVDGESIDLEVVGR